MTATETRDVVAPSAEQTASQGPPLEGCALVTGASRGIGAAIASRLSDAGWPVAINYRSDREGAERTMQQLLGALSLRSSGNGKTPVLKTTATTGEGIAALTDAVTRIGARSANSNPTERRRRRARYLIARAAADLVAQRIKADGTAAVDRLADQVLTGALSPEDAARRLLEG